MDLDNSRKLIAAALAAVGSGDPNALQTVYRLTATKLFAVCLRILGDRSEAEDVLQEVYMTVWSKAAVFDAALSSPMTWLIAITRNRSIDHAGRTAAWTRSRRLLSSPTTSRPPTRLCKARRSRQSCNVALDGLAGHERAALRGAFFDGNTYEELAGRMKVPLGTMRPTGPTRRASPSYGWSLPAVNRCRSVFCPQTAPARLPSLPLLLIRPGAMPA